MAVIQARGKAQNKRFQFTAPADIVDEFLQKKEQLEASNLVVDLTDDFVKVLKEAIKAIDKRLADGKESQNLANTNGVNSQPNV
jgi:hypothetical protein